MKKLNEKQKENLKTALELLCEETTTLSKVKKLSTILKNTNPKIENQVESVIEIIEKIQAVQDGDVIGLSAERLPEKTKEQKKRKKLILLLLSRWGKLQSEVERMNALYSTASASGLASKQTAVKAGKIGATMKGPAGLITIAAAGIVAVGTLINNKSVEINVINSGCPPIQSPSSKAIDIPGLSLPSESIENGSEGTVKIPGVNATVQMDASGSGNIKILGINKDFSLPYVYSDVVFNGKSMLGTTTQVELSKNKTHELKFICER